MLAGSLFTISDLDHSQGHITCQVQLDATHPVFQGHFPGSPVLPGVVQLEILKFVLTETLGKPYRLVDMSTCKFLGVINPMETRNLTIRIQYKGNETLDVNATGSHAEEVFFKVRANFRPFP